MIRNKLVAAGVGSFLAIGLGVVCATLERLAPHATALGFLIRTVPMLIAVPLVLVVFNFLCDRWEWHDRAEVDASQKSKQQTRSAKHEPANRGPAKSARPETRQVIGRITRTENFRLSSSESGWTRFRSLFSHSL
jgi:hypothetical protein